MLSFPNIDPVAFEIGPLVFRWYALAYLAGILGGWWCALKLLKQYGPSPLNPTKEQIDDFIVWVILGIVLGGRLGYVLFYNLPYYIENPFDIPKIWHGGMSFHGGATGVILAIIFFALKKKLSVLRLGDIVCCVVPIGLFFGRIANFINGELYGRITDGPWGMVFPHGGPEPRHPSQLYEAGLEGLLIFITLMVLHQIKDIREKHGFIAGMFLLDYGIFRFIIEYVREPDEQIGEIFGFITMGQVLCLPMMIAGSLLIMFSVINSRRHVRA
ncbi:MAG: prolipoprotein diacylglyceryl transferase [Alphaproteobacteria bacterium]|nr:prolipoprotein diacylglyceryl transferase [Alphaproteobacteria bacterium]